MPRPPMPVGGFGNIQMTHKGNGQWRARCRFRDRSGTTVIERATPPHVTDDPGGEQAKIELLREIDFRRRQMTLIDPDKRHRLPFSPHGFYVYILWGTEGQQCPLYIGQSTNVLRRVGQHFASERGPQIRDVEFIECQNAAEMDRLEVNLIESLGGSWNIAHNAPAHVRRHFFNADNVVGSPLKKVPPPGLEPGTCGLKVRSSTN